MGDDLRETIAELRRRERRRHVETIEALDAMEHQLGRLAVELDAIAAGLDAPGDGAVTTTICGAKPNPSSIHTCGRPGGHDGEHAADMPDGAYRWGDR